MIKDSLRGGFDICNNKGTLSIIKEMLNYGEIYPLVINTNSMAGRAKELKLHKINDQLSAQIQEYCISIKKLKEIAP